MSGFATAACYAVASGGILPADKRDLDACLGSLNPSQVKEFRKMEARLQKVAPFKLMKPIGTWVGNTCSLLSKGGVWDRAEDLAALPPNEPKPIWLPHKEALIAVEFSNSVKK
jgi:hypothetical protein